MATRDISVKLDANVSGLAAGFGRAAAATRGLATSIEREMGRATKHLHKHRQAYTEVSDAMLRLGAVGAIALGGAVKAAMDWESAWTGVRKTVTGSTAEMAQLESELRAMARVMPTTHKDIAAVAEAAGQMGVAVPDIAEFSKVMVQLGDTTDLTARTSALKLGQFVKVMGTASDEMDNLGATVVDLGNNFPTVESQIVDMAQRISGAGSQFGLAESDVLAFATAISSVGIRAEAGGTAFSTALIKINSAVEESSDKLDILAEVSDVSAQEFANAWQNDAAGAVTMFIEGLGRMQQSGENTTQVMYDLGLSAVRERDNLLRLASAGDTLSDALDVGATAFENQSALAIEAAKRYGTTASQMRIAMNNIKDTGIDLGQTLLPVVSGMATSATNLAQAFGDLPTPMQGFITKATLIASVGLLAGGSVAKMAVNGAQLVTSLKEISGNSTRATSRLKRFGRGAAIAAGSVLVLQAGVAALEAAFGDTGLTSTQASQLLVKVAEDSKVAGREINKAFQFERGILLKERIDGVGEALDGFNDAGLQFSKTVGDFFGAGSVLGQAEDSFAELDTALTDMSQNGSLELAQDAFAGISKEVDKTEKAIRGVPPSVSVYASAAREMRDVNEETRHSAEDLLAQFPSYHEELRRTAKSLGEHNISAEEYVAWMGGEVPDAIKKAKRANNESTASFEEVAVATQQTQEELNELVDALFAYEEQTLATADAQLNFQESIDNARKAVKEGKKTLDVHTQAGRDNRRALLDLAESTQRYVEEQAKQGAKTERLTKITEKGRQKFIETARQMGATKEEAKRLADQYGLVPENVATRIQTPGMQKAKNELDGLYDKITGLPTSKKINLEFDVFASGNKMDFDRASVSGWAQMRATGGPVFGPGGPTEDKIPAWLSNGEFVEPTASVEYYGSKLFELLRRRMIPKEMFAPLGLRDGGQVNTNIQIPTQISTDVTEAIGRMVGDSFGAVRSGAAEDLQSLMIPGGTRLGSDQLINWRGHTFTQNFARHLAWVHARHPYSIFQGGFRPATSYSGTSHAGDAVDTTRPSALLVQLMRAAGIAYWDRTGYGNWAPHGHGVPLPGAGRAGGSGVWQAQDYLRGGNGLGGPDYHPKPARNSTSIGSAKFFATGGMVGERTVPPQFMRSGFRSSGSAMSPTDLSALFKALQITARFENPYTGDVLLQKVKDISVSQLNDAVDSASTARQR